MMKGILLVFLIGFLSLGSAAQKTGQYLSEVEDPYLNVLSVYKSHSYQLNEDDLDSEFSRLLQDLFPDLSFEFEYFIESPGGYHANFIQTHQGYPVFNHFVRLILIKALE